jgi:hypothetical protein
MKRTLSLINSRRTFFLNHYTIFALAGLITGKDPYALSGKVLKIKELSNV